MDNRKKSIREYAEARGGMDALTEDEKKALVEEGRYESPEVRGSLPLYPTI